MRTVRSAPLEGVELRAYHEAAHAVVAVARGLAVGRVSVALDGAVGGSCEYGVRAAPRTAAARRRALRDHLAVVLAGSVAQERLATERGYASVHGRDGTRRPPFASGAEDDARAAVRLAGRAYAEPEARAAFLRRMRARVERLLGDRVVWGAVGRLARQLVRRGAVGGREARAAVRTAIAEATAGAAPRGGGARGR